MRRVLSGLANFKLLLCVSFLYMALMLGAFLPAAAEPVPCDADFDHDGDVDGLDLQTYVSKVTGIGLSGFAQEFGLDYCEIPLLCTDEDGDGFGEGIDCLGPDCDDTDGTIHPNAAEICDDVDNNCDGRIDEEGAEGCSYYHFDGDGDGYGIPGDARCLCLPEAPYTSLTGIDCDDHDLNTYPGAGERCDGKDNDCDGQTDETGADGCSFYYRDSDGDTYGLSGDMQCLCASSAPYVARRGGDCNDSDASSNPGATENCMDSRDNDCDGAIDQYDANCSTCLGSSYEPNNTCGGSYYLGTIDEFASAKSWSTTIYHTGDKDYFRFYAQEGTHTCFPLTDQDYTIRIRMTPPQGTNCRDYDIALYNDGCGTILSSQSGGCAEEVITYTWDGICGADDSRYFRVRVVGWAGAFHCAPYTLSIDMWQN